MATRGTHTRLGTFSATRLRFACGAAWLAFYSIFRLQSVGSAVSLYALFDILFFVCGSRCLSAFRFASRECGPTQRCLGTRVCLCETHERVPTIRMLVHKPDTNHVVFRQCYLSRKVATCGLVQLCSRIVSVFRFSRKNVRCRK